MKKVVLTAGVLVLGVSMAMAQGTTALTVSGGTPGYTGGGSVGVSGQADVLPPAGTITVAKNQNLTFNFLAAGDGKYWKVKKVSAAGSPFQTSPVKPQVDTATAVKWDFTANWKNAKTYQVRITVEFADADKKDDVDEAATTITYPLTIIVTN